MSLTTVTLKNTKAEILQHTEALTYKIVSMESRTFTWGELFSLLRDKTQQSWAVHLTESGAAVRDLYSAGQQTRVWFETFRKEMSQPLIR